MWLRMTTAEPCGESRSVASLGRHQEASTHRIEKERRLSLPPALDKLLPLSSRLTCLLSFLWVPGTVHGTRLKQ